MQEVSCVESMIYDMQFTKRGRLCLIYFIEQPCRTHEPVTTETYAATATYPFAQSGRVRIVHNSTGSLLAVPPSAPSASPPPEAWSRSL